MEFDERPWGNYLVLEDKPKHKVKRITVYPKKRLSLQRHKHRQEHWYVIIGKAEVTLERKKIILKFKGKSTKSFFRIENPFIF